MFRPVVTKLLLSGSTASNQSHTAVIDTLGYDKVTIGLAESTVAETTGHITFKIGEGDTTSAFTDVATALHGTDQAATNTSVANTYQVDVDCRTRKRYLLLTVTPFTTKTLTSWVAYQNPEIAPQSADNAGLRATTRCKEAPARVAPGRLTGGGMAKLATVARQEARPLRLNACLKYPCFFSL